MKKALALLLVAIQLAAAPAFAADLAAPAAVDAAISVGASPLDVPSGPTFPTALDSSPLAASILPTEPIAPKLAAQTGFPAVAAAVGRLDSRISERVQAMSEGGLDSARGSGEQISAQLQGGFFIGASPAAAETPAPSEFFVSPANFEVTDKIQDVGEIFDELRGIKDPAARDRILLSRAKIDLIDLRRVERGAPMSRAELDAYAKKLPAVLTGHFLDTLSRHEHEKTPQGGVDAYRVKDGLAFWIDFATPADPEKRRAAQVFIQGLTRRRLSKDPAYQLIAALTESPMAVTRVVDASRVTPTQWQALSRFSEQNELSLARFGRYGLIGRGAGFHLTNDVLIAAQDIKDPVLAKRLERVLAFLGQRGIDITNDENVGAAAFFNPMDDRLAYVMPSRAGLNAFSHESTHARFHRFEQRLKNWAAGRKLAIPYEADGPFVALLADFGGFMNLLNELNSWRTGESFDGGKTDEAILEILRDSYGRQAGAAAAALFTSLWPATKVAGVSVPRLILRAVRELNRLAERDLPELARRPDEPSQINFLRLVSARYADSVPLPQAIEDQARALAGAGATEGVRWSVKRLLEAKGKSHEEPDAAKSRDQREYSRAAGKWIEGFGSDKIKVIPADLRFGSVATFRYAAETGLFDYDELARRLQARWGGLFRATDDERALFAAVAAEPGATWEQKLTSYLTKYNETGFPALWKGFADAPTFNLRQLLIENHKDDFKPEHVRQLALWALEPGTRPELQSAAAELLSDLMEAQGLSAIYGPEELKTLQAMQRAMNERSGKPRDAFMPVGRAPNSGHWLFSAAIDEALAQAMFDGKPGTFRLKMIELITQRTYPEELPRLRARLIQVITDPKIDRYDQWVARMFLIPSNQIFHTHVAWGEAVAAAVLADSAPNATALEFVGEFYRLGLGPTFRGPSWGKFVGNLDAGRRAETEAAIAKLSPEAAQRYRRALDELWRLLGADDQKVRTAALYAIAFNPVFLTGLEDRLAAELSAPASKYRFAAVKLAGMLRPGFSPKLDAALVDLTPSETEKALLWPRLSPAG